MKSRLILFFGVVLSMFVGSSIYGQACTLTPPANVTVGMSPGLCTANVTGLIATASTACAATVTILTQQFTTCAPVAGWTVTQNTTLLPPYTAAAGAQTFTYAGVGNTDCGTPPPSMTGCRFEISDDDSGSAAPAGVTCLVSPVVNTVAGGLVNPSVSYAWCHQALGHNFVVQRTIDGGATWADLQVITTTSSSSANGAPDPDVFAVPASATLQVRWCLDDSGVASWGWGAAVDNITFSAVNPNLIVITNSYNAGGANASGIYPKGTTTVVFRTTNAAGQIVSGTTTVTVIDNQAPTLTCPTNSIIALDAGECHANYYYTVTAVDNCPATPFTLVGPFCNPCTAPSGGSALACSAGPNSIIQGIDVSGLTGTNYLNGVCFNQETFGTTSTVTVNVFCGSASPVPWAAGGFTPLISEVFALSQANNGLCVCLNFTTPIVLPTNCGILWVEFVNAVGRSVQTPATCSGGAGATGNLSYIVGPACGLTTPGLFSGIGFALDMPLSVLIQPSALEAVPAPGNPGTFDAPNGEASLDIGTSCFTFTATDAAVPANTATCTWCVEVREFPEALQSHTLACNDHVNISVDESCDAIITADMILEGGPYGCYETYNITVTGVPAAAVTGNGTGEVTIDATKIAAFVANGMAGPYTISVSDPDNNNNACWGTFMLEDKLPPTITCEDVTIACITPTTPANPTTGTVSALQTNTGVVVPLTAGAGISNPLAISLPPGSKITDVNVSLDQSHTWVSDLEMYIQGPDGTEATLLNSQCADNDNINATFDDEASAGPSCTGNPTVSGVVKPSTPLSVFDGLGGTGNWRIRWVDNAGGDGGPMNSFGLEVSYIIGAATPAVASDNCAAIVPTYSDFEVPNGCGSVIVRQWQATDAKGNKSDVCVQYIFVEPISAFDLGVPPSLILLPCHSGTDPADIAAYFDDPNTKDNANTAIIENHEGYPYGYFHYFVNGHAQKVDNHVCNIYTAYTDQTITACGQGCGGNKKVIRTWTILDWCTGELFSYIQLIKASDLEAPTAIFKDITVSTSPWYCAADFDVPQPWELHDNCDPNPHWTVSGPSGVVITGNQTTGYRASGAPKGVHLFVYTLTDCCGNFNAYAVYVTVVDKTAPVAVAKQNIVVSLTSGGPNGTGNAKIFPYHIDNGSYDQCTAVHLEIRRTDGSPACNNWGLVINPTTGERYNNNVTYDNTKHEHDNDRDTDGGQYVKFCCEDLTEIDPVSGVPFGLVQVWLRVWDDGDMDGLFGTAGDNYNETWAYVRVEDKLAPVLTCPPDVTVYCDMDLNISTTRTTATGIDLSLTGGPAVAYGTCGNVGVDYQDLPQLNSCNVGTITRRYFVAGRNDVFCVQRITVLAQNSFFNVTPPGSSIISTTCNFTEADIKDSEKPVATGGPCDVIGENITVDTFYFEDGACKKWRVRYEYINWCTNELKGPYFRYYKYEDQIKPVLTECEDRMFPVDGNCEAVLTVTNTATDEGACTGGWLKWQVFVDLWGDGTIDWEFSSFVSGGTNPADNNNNGIPDIFVKPTSSGQQLSITVPGVIAGNMSNHKVSWKVTDGCGNVTACDYNVMIVDKKDPTPYCVSLSSAVMANGQVELWARDFDKGSFDNCTPKEDLLFTFNEAHPVLTKLNIVHYFKGLGLNATEAEYNQGNAQKWVPDFKSSSKIFDCDEVPSSEVHMTVWDGKFNSDFCVVTLTLVDNQGACGGSRVAGNLTTTNNEPIANVVVTVDASNNEVLVTNVSGKYGPLNVAAGINYQISADKKDDYSNGVSTLDLVIIQRHILNMAKINNAYKLIAADVTNDKKVNAADLVELRKLILHSIDKFANNSSWKFMPTTEVMTTADPYTYNSKALITNAVASEQYNNDFFGVKIGDVNGSVIANLNATASEGRTADRLTLVSADKAVNTGDVVELNVTAQNFKEVFGYQFTANLNGLTLSNVRSGALTIEDSNYGLVSDNTMTMSYSAGTAQTFADGEVLFTMVFKANANGNLSNMIALGSEVTKAESYTTSDLNVGGIELSFRTEPGVVAEGYSLFQNEPNPFKGETLVSYYMPKAGAAKFTLFDVTGRIILVKNETAVKGSNTVRFNKTEVGTSGVVYYQIESGDFTATKKMIILE